MKIIDLSALIEPTPADAPPFMSIGIDYHNHDSGASQVENLLKVPARLMRRGEGWATETITNLMTHNTTHVDAPWHYNSVIRGEKAMSIDEIPLEWFFRDGVRLDMTHKKEGEPVTIDDIETELAKTGYQLKEYDIVLVNTAMDTYYSEPGYIFRGCGVTAEATVWLYDQGVRVMGIDAWGWDVPLNLQAREAVEKDSTGIFWSAHQADIQYCHMERLVNLSSLPLNGFKVACFPLKIKGGSAGPARVVAILNS